MLFLSTVTPTIGSTPYKALRERRERMGKSVRIQNSECDTGSAEQEQPFETGDVVFEVVSSESAVVELVSVIDVVDSPVSDEVESSVPEEVITSSLGRVCAVRMFEFSGEPKLITVFAFCSHSALGSSGSVFL